MQTDADLYRRLASVAPLGIPGLQPPDHVQRSPHGVIGPARKQRHDGVTDKFVDDPAMARDGRLHRAEILVHEAERLRGGHAVRHSGEVTDVREKHGHFALHLVAKRNVDDALLAQLLQELPGYEPRIAVADLGEFEMDADARQQFVAGKGLGQIIVRSHAEPHDEVRDAVLGCQQDHRQFRGRVVFTNALADVEARQLRHHHIEQDDVARSFAGQKIKRLLPVRGRDDVVLCQGQEVHQSLNIYRLVVHHQNPQTGAGG